MFSDYNCTFSKDGDSFTCAKKNVESFTADQSIEQFDLANFIAVPDVNYNPTENRWSQPNDGTCDARCEREGPGCSGYMVNNYNNTCFGKTNITRGLKNNVPYMTTLMKSEVALRLQEKIVVPNIKWHYTRNGGLLFSNTDQNAINVLTYIRQYKTFVINNIRTTNNVKQTTGENATLIYSKDDSLILNGFTWVFFNPSSLRFAENCTGTFTFGY